jgi:hypothetical protein
MPTRAMGRYSHPRLEALGLRRSQRFSQSLYFKDAGFGTGEIIVPSLSYLRPGK